MRVTGELLSRQSCLVYESLVSVIGLREVPVARNELDHHGMSTTPYDKASPHTRNAQRALYGVEAICGRSDAWDGEAGLQDRGYEGISFGGRRGTQTQYLWSPKTVASKDEMG